MVLINPKQLEWLVVNQPETEHDIIDPSEFTGEFHPCRAFSGEELDWQAHGIDLEYYLTPETYNSLPTEFKQLADATT
jgi:hypothetical protein